MKNHFLRSALACLLLAAVMLTPLQGAGTEAIPAAQGQMPDTLRILLSRLGITTQADIEISGTYAMTFGELTMLFPSGSAITVLLIDGGLYVDYLGLRLGGGTELTLTRYQNAEGGENGLRFAGNTALYEGDLSLKVSEGIIRAILFIGVEEYLLGVVPYEMSDSFPLEALKAQAVAARTYAVRRAQQSGARDYDLADTTRDLVFRGRQAAYARTEQAVSETAGVCAFYGSSLAMCYYGSSNGGQTELVENQWGAGEDTGYLDMRDDPYDLENPKSVQKSAVLLKSAISPEQTPYGLRALIAGALREELRQKGYDPAPESLRIDTVAAVSVDTPEFAAPSRLYTTFHITFTYSARTRTDPVVITSSILTSALTDQVEISLFTVPPEQPTPIPPPTETPAPTPTPQPVYGPFEPVSGAVTLSFPIFPDAESALQLSINLYDNELWTVTQTDAVFTVEARRFGHGVGMSQYGAEWMASQYGFAYAEILAFYYPGVTLMRYASVDLALPQVSSVFTREADPPPSPTPRPTLMPVTGVPAEGQWYAKVTNIGENSWLNLRAEPNLSAEILTLLFKDQRLLVLERMPQEGWVHVKTDTAEGYVMEEFLEK
ncbi:MAG: SpoIID/LytB domain-containing protein, partial [Bacillota bacterium]